MSRNKSRKRILHEQRVEIARLNRELDYYKKAMSRARWHYQPTETICYTQLIRSEYEKEELENLFENAGERIIRDIVRKIISSNVMQITTDRGYPHSHLTAVTFKLRFMSRECTDIEPRDAFKGVQWVNFYEPDFMYGGPRMSEEKKRLILGDRYGALINSVWRQIDENT